jgi:dimethylglycine dehydrogenase
MLTHLGGIECEMTITRLGPERFYINSAIMGELHDLDWLNFHVEPGEDIVVRDVTEDMAILAVGGPRARDIVQPLTDADLSNDSFKWLTGQEITVAGVACIALRVSYIGELGWELHHPIDQMATLYDALVESGDPHGMVHYGSYAMNAMRIEKGYKAWGSELTTEITPVEARLNRFVNMNKDFLGKSVVEERFSSTARSMPMTPTAVETNRSTTATDSSVSRRREPMGTRLARVWPSPTSTPAMKRREQVSISP